MFGLGFWELVVIIVAALLFIGPEKLPNFFRALGRATREFQRASRELRENLSLDEEPPRRPPPPPRPPSGSADLPPAADSPPKDPPVPPAGRTEGGP
jgi:TatA/E family protein of Tat protein translocase